MQPSREQLEALAEFAAGAGHEINNPLATIAGHAQLLLRQIEDPGQRRSLAVILAQTQRAYEMIADIRLFARPPEPRFELFDPVRLIDELVRKQRSELADRSIEIVFDPEESVLELESDPTQLSVVLLALFRNSAESIDENGTITISLGLREKNPAEKISGERNSKEGDSGVIEIVFADDGPGIPEEIRPLIFSPYYSGRQAGRGLGFGLPKAWRIINQCGGSIELNETVADSTAFRIRLPLRWNS